MTTCSNPCNSAPGLADDHERQITKGPGGRILSNTSVWSPDGQWIVFDTRPDSEGAIFEGKTIEMVSVSTGEVKELYRAQNGAHCGVVTFDPRARRVAFILGPEHPAADWQYCPWHRQGVVVGVNHPG